jgi:hypothetical protein
MRKVEQIDSNLNVIIDYDVKITKKDIKEILSNHYKIINNKNPFECLDNKNRKFFFCIKQITYLGNPHHIFKKRIQIPAKWRRFLQKENVFLLGLYVYENNRIFVFFDTKKYKDNRLNNSSAHVHTIDLQKGLEYGIFKKEDIRKNKITVVRGDKIYIYVDNLLSRVKTETPKEIKLFDDFSKTINLIWSGIACYDEMFIAEYRNRAQPEWPGFYLEFKFEDFLNNNPHLKEVCTLVSDKKKNKLDFDLNFANKYLGDLKAHCINTYSIPGNDKKNFNKALNAYGKFWYVVFSHSTKKDKDFNNEVTIYWNTLQNKKNILSYAKRMKNSIQLKNIKILEINKNNVKYISDMTQGKNSDGNKRKIKIQIKNSAIDNFIIFNKELK